MPQHPTPEATRARMHALIDGVASLCSQLRLNVTLHVTDIERVPDCHHVYGEAINIMCTQDRRAWLDHADNAEALLQRSLGNMRQDARGALPATDAAQPPKHLLN